MTNDEFRRKNLHFMCPVPELTDCDAWAFNTDLDEMTELTLRSEFERVKDRMKYDPHPPPWLLVRHDGIKVRLNDLERHCRIKAASQ